MEAPLPLAKISTGFQLAQDIEAALENEESLSDTKFVKQMWQSAYCPQSGHYQPFL